MKQLWCDLETYCEVPIANGTHVYAESAETMLFAYGVDEKQAKVWDLTTDDKMPSEVEDGLSDERVLTLWHNGGMFDRTVLRHDKEIILPTSRIFDTMACAFAHGLPGKLEKLCDIFGLEEDKAKDKAGKQLIQLFCKPQKFKHSLKKEDFVSRKEYSTALQAAREIWEGRATRETHPEKWQDFINYAARDIESMRIIYRKLPKWNYRGKEFDLWQLDQKINDRGFKVDIDLAEKAIETIGRTQKKLSKQTAEATKGEVGSTTQRDKLLRYILAEYDISLPDMQASTIKIALDDPELPEAVKELLSNRLQATTSSTSKYKKLLGAVSPDDRLRGTMQFCGAHRTGRWSGRTFQPQNLPRPMYEQKDIDDGVEAIKAGCADMIWGPDVMKIISSSIRGCIIAPVDRKLVVSDLSNIEGRAAAWLANEEWKLKAFTSFDKGTGADLYTLAYARAFDVEASSIDKKTLIGYLQRQIGKVMELFLQYEGGVGAFITGAATYNIDLNQMTESAWDSIPSYIMKEAENMWFWAIEQKRTLGLDKHVFVVCDSLKRMWREKHPAIAGYWPELRETISQAISSPGKTFIARKLKIINNGGWLRIILPSGRSLCYPSPRVESGGGISYAGVNQYSRKWDRIGTYGGKLFENICQAVARDVMAENMPMIENEGYEIILSVHDELLTEAVDDKYWNAETLSKLLATNPVWAEGMPLAAGGFETYRYKKE